jgi:hypothetical protein
MAWKWYGSGMEVVWKWYGSGMEVVWKWYGSGMELLTSIGKSIIKKTYYAYKTTGLLNV